MAEEGQKAYEPTDRELWMHDLVEACAEAISKARKRPPDDDDWMVAHICVYAVERTIANEALRRAAQVTRAVQARYSGRSDVDRGGWMAAEDIADGMNALIKEPGHE